MRARVLRVLQLLVCGAPAAWLLVGLAGAQEPSSNPIPADAESLAAGKALYDRYCGFCHGYDGEGGPPKEATGAAPSAFDDDTWSHGSADQDIFDVIRDGIGSEMEPWSDRLSVDETWHLVNYIRTFADNADSDASSE